MHLLFFLFFFFPPLNKLSKNWPPSLFRLRNARRRESTRTDARLDAQIGKAHGWNVFTLRTSFAERPRDVTRTGAESLWGKEGSPRCSDGEVLEVCHYDVRRLVLQLVAGLDGVAVPLLALDVLVLALQLLQLLLGLGRQPLLRTGCRVCPGLCLVGVLRDTIPWSDGGSGHNRGVSENPCTRLFRAPDRLDLLVQLYNLVGACCPLTPDIIDGPLLAEVVVLQYFPDELQVLDSSLKHDLLF
uniref:Putative secreted protein n=1 Tax=Ixodes ricinus TaxID=34613 RepID=A0A6B0V458_IXORI